MSLSLTRLQRNVLFALSGCAYGLAFITDASALRAQPAADSLRVAPHREPRTIVVAASIRRDPFAATPAPERFAAHRNGDDAGGGAGFAPVPAGLTVPGIDGQPETVADVLPASRTLSLKATIAGADPVAYVVDGSTLTIVRAGDSVEGLRVRSIDLRGLEFADGTRLDLPERATPTRAPRAPGVQRSRATDAPPVTADATVAPAPAASEATPAPLPTPKPGAYPLGSRPTSDPAAPTALPYPYPYAPH
jgi:hypothetical protein